MATNTWLGANGASWGTAGASSSNWSTGTSPVAGDAVVFGTTSVANQAVNAGVDVPAIISISATPTSTNRWNIGGATAGTRAAGSWTLPSGGADVTVTGTTKVIGLALWFASINGSSQIRKKGNAWLYIPHINDTEGSVNNNWTGGLDVQEGGVGTVGNENGAGNTMFGTGPLTFAANTSLFNGSTTIGLVLKTPGGVTINGNWESVYNTTSTSTVIRMDGTVALNNSPTITVSNATTATAGGLNFNNTVSGTSGFTKAGTSPLTLGVANTVSGTVGFTAGATTVNNANGLQNATLNTNQVVGLSIPATSALGGLTGTANWNGSSATNLTIGGGTLDVSATWTGGFTSNITLTKRGTGTQQISGNSTGRTTALTTINAGAIQINASGSLYGGASPTGTTTVNSGAGLWLSGGISTPVNAGITINGTGVTLDGAIRNISGNNTIGSTVTVSSPQTLIKNAASGTTLTLKALTLGTANSVTLDSGSGATIRMDAAATGTNTSELIITGAGSITTATTGVLAAAVNRINGTFNSSNTQSIASTKVLDGVGTITGAGALSMASGSTLRAGNGAGDGTLTVPNLTFASGTQTFQTYKNGSGAVSKVAIVGALTHTTGSAVQVNASAPSWVSGSTHTFLTYASRSGAGTFTAGTLTGKTSRQSISIDTAGDTAQTFTIAGNGNTSVAWSGGDAGNWYPSQATGWQGSDVTNFLNGDTVTFDATSSATATLTDNVSVASLTMNAAAHTIGGAFTITNAGALTTAGAFKQTLNAAATHAGNVSIGTGSTLEIGNTGALGGSGTGITLASAANLAFTSGANGLLTTRTLTLSPNDTSTRYLQTSGNAVATITGTVSGGQSTGFLTKIGAGLVSLTGLTSGVGAVVRVGEQGNNAGVGLNVLRLANMPTANMRLNAASILELNVTSDFTRGYGTGATQIYLEDTTGAGAGFSAFRPGGADATVSTSITFGTAGATTQWNGPMYFGSALSSATGRVVMTGVLSLASTQATQTFHVFNGATTGAASTARISDLRSNLYNGSVIFTKAGPGTLFIAGGSGNAFSRTLLLTEGALEVGPTTTSPISQIEIPSGATNTVVRHEASTSAATCPAFNPDPIEDFTLEAASSFGTFSISNALVIGDQNVTLSGSGTGIKSSYSGNGTGKYIKTGTGTWSLSYAYASRAAGFSGGADVTAGTLKVTQKFGLGSGPVAVTAGAKIQFTDTTTDPTIIGSIASLSTTGSTARLIIGA
jgi:fibronectin-binding autotransporter adhesin